jgi:hypothetical protein
MMTKISITKNLKYLDVRALEFIWSLEFGDWNLIDPVGKSSSFYD